MDRTTDPDGWQRLVDTDVPLVTQRADDGAPVSSSMPYMVATMLRHLAPEPGDCVLEIGILIAELVKLSNAWMDKLRCGDERLLRLPRSSLIDGGREWSGGVCHCRGPATYRLRMCRSPSERTRDARS